MANPFDELLNYDQDFSDPVSRAATAQALRRQYNYGTLGQLMGVDPTAKAGTAMQEGSMGSLKMALGKQNAMKEAKARQAEQDAAQKRWEAEQAESKRQFGANYGLKQRELSISQAKAMADQNGLKVRVDPVSGNPLGWYNERGDYWNLLGEHFSPPGGGAPRGGPTIGQVASDGPGPGLPTGQPAGGGGGDRGQPMQSPFGLPPTSGSPQMFGGPQGGQPASGAQSLGLSDAAGAGYVTSKIKQLPAEQQNAYYAYQNQVKSLPRVVAQIRRQAGAFGPLSDVSQYIPGQPGQPMESVQKMVRAGQDALRPKEDLKARAAVYNQAYQVIHSLAGAALSTGERQRLEAFLPSPTDPIEKIIANLEQAYTTAGYGVNDFEERMGVPEQLRTRVPALEDLDKQPDKGGEEEIIDLPPRSR